MISKNKGEILKIFSSHFFTMCQFNIKLLMEVQYNE